MINIVESLLLDTSKVYKWTEFCEEYEFRKGSDEFGSFITLLMEWLRMHKTDKTTDTISVNLNAFLKENPKIELSTLQKFIQMKQKTNLVNFSIKIEGDELIFYDLNKSYSQDML